MNEKEVHKKVSPKFTVCFMDLASYMGISLQPIVESAEKSKEALEEQDYQNSAISQMDRGQNPSVIKEEYEHENEDQEDNNSKENVDSSYRAQ